MASLGTPAPSKPLRRVPKWVLLAIPAAFSLQFVWHVATPDLYRSITPLQDPPNSLSLRIASLDDPIALAKLFMLWLQAYDNQPGISLSYRELDFVVLGRWLQRLLELDPRAQYPLLAASHLYAETPLELKQRQMLDFVYQQFLHAPNRRWPWLVHGVYIAKHRLHDLHLALHYAQALATETTADAVPGWVRQIQIFLYEDLGEKDRAKQLLQALLASGEITERAERSLLQSRLESLQAQ